jgi:5-methylthioadenosine/S-adenosylhomocysteine deaminase
LRGVAADWTLDHYFGVLIGKVVSLYTPKDVFIGNLVGALDQINCGVTTLFDGATSSIRRTMPTPRSTRSMKRALGPYSGMAPP